MELPSSPHNLALVSELHRLDLSARPLERAVAKGEVVRVHRGAYMSAHDWRELDRHERYRSRVIAAGLVARGRPILSHHSAAAIWGIPIIGAWPSVVHVLTTRSAGTRKENGFQRHATAIDDEDVVEFEGVRVTSLRRTLIDLARDTSFASAVAGLDWSLHSPAKGMPARILIADLQEYFDTIDWTRNRRKVYRALEFADGRAESPGESLSRVVIHELGFPQPELQVRIVDRDGLAGVSDFGWEGFRHLGEFDGLVKYTRGMARPGESIDQIVVREKVREDRIRATRRGMSRWLWADALAVRPLYEILIDAGLPSTYRGPVHYKGGR